MRILLMSMPNAIMAFIKGARIPNLALSSLAGNLETGHKVAIADLVLCRGNLKKYLARLLKDFCPDVLGLTCFSFQYDTAIRIAKMAKELDPTVRIALGGYHPTLCYENIPEEESQYIDLIVRHEGEKTFRNLIRALEGKQDLADIPGLSYKANGEFIHNPAAGNLNLEEIALPDRTSRILFGYHAWGRPCDVIETSRGCTFDCSFCTIIKMYGRTFRRYPIERIIQDIGDAQARGAKAIFMVDDNITLNMGHLEEVCDAIIASKLNHIHYIIQASVRGISSSKKVVDKMGKAGFKTVFLGIENASDGNLEFFRKDNQVNLDRTERAVAYLRENRIIVLGATIVGNPEDTEESIWQNFHFLKKLKVDGPLFFNPTPLPMTELREETLKMGLVVNRHDFSWYMGTKANSRSYHLSPEEINRIVLEMYKRYHNFFLLAKNNVRKHYPRYFYKRLLKEGAASAWNGLTLGLGFYDRDPLRIALKRDTRRREQWLLGNLNGNCSCFNCSFARGEAAVAV
ncbi:MAG: radical SAM protein [Candidatus Neomarinimicrobiota bacterium]